jgi:DNA-binding MarR family transcriptional regulator
MPSPPGSDDALVAELEHLWVELGRSFVRRRQPGAERSSHAADLSPVQLLALAQLAEPLRVGELADRLGVAESTATRLVDRLAALGLVARSPGAEDRRSVAVQLTLRGRRTAERVAEGRRAYLAGILAALEPGERRRLVHLFAKVVAVQAERERADDRPSHRRSTA